MIKQSVHQNDLRILNVYIYSNRSSKFVKLNLIQQPTEIAKYTVLRRVLLTLDT